MNRLGPSAMIKVGGVPTNCPSSRVPGRSGVGHASPGSYTVRSGDTVCGIAQRFGVVCDDLLAANGLKTTSVLTIGRNLVIPGGWRFLPKGVPTPSERAIPPVRWP
ncbi:MAG: hypothetical protein Ct9H300mP16_16010 [Pseudomonadota bacterium]|nr:MAG: hypothetical protein Ct9H300mP16_16010 [Pseudomonadota bacterium]